MAIHVDVPIEWRQRSTSDYKNVLGGLLKHQAILACSAITNKKVGSTIEKAYNAAT